MSATIYNSIQDVTKCIMDSYKESNNVVVILDVDFVMPILQYLLRQSVNGVGLEMDVESNSSLFTELHEAEKNRSAVMVSIMENKTIVVERVHTEYMPCAYPDMLFIVQDKCRDCVEYIKPDYYSLFTANFDPFELAF